MSDNYDIKDSGERRTFESGAVRDIVDGKGRCDLMPLEEIGEALKDIDPISGEFLIHIGKFIYEGNPKLLVTAFKIFLETCYDDKDGYDDSEKWAQYLLELSRHYENGCKKYGERNWERGIPLHSFIDSAVRHYFKWMLGWDDEPHRLAVGWNIFGALWTLHHKQRTMLDLPFSHPSEIYWEEKE